MNDPHNQNDESTFENWHPDDFAEDAMFMRTIRTFTSGLIAGDILDVGCGSRIFYDLSAAKSWVGLDISKRMLDSIQFVDDFESKKIMQGDVLDLPFEDNSFDTVTAFFLLHHLARKNRKLSAVRVQKAFEEVFRVLRPGGRFIVSENCSGPIERPYHLLFAPIYYIALKIFDTEMPYFWKPKNFLNFAEASGFNPKTPYMHVPIVESIYQPVAKVTTPAILNGDLIQKMTVFDFVKSA